MKKIITNIVNAPAKVKSFFTTPRSVATDRFVLVALGLMAGYTAVVFYAGMQMKADSAERVVQVVAPNAQAATSK